MSLPDAAHSAALDGEVIKPVWFAWLDIVGDPVRANTSGADRTPTGTGDTDLDGETFIGISGTLVEISSVKVKDGGSESVTAQLSGLQGVDSDTIALLADPTNWRGRDARLWRIVRNAANEQQGGFHPYYTGKMTALSHKGDSTGQTLRVTIESYLAVFSEASGRSYLDQSRYDPGDESARAAIAIANGDYGNAGTSGTGGHCPEESTPILLANEYGNGPGREITAAELHASIERGEQVFVWSAHEHTGQWGAWKVLSAKRVRAPLYSVPLKHLPQALPNVPVRAFKATAEHPIGGAPWQLFGDLGAPAGEGWVISMEVEEAHTFVSAGVLSHNKQKVSIF